MILTWAFDRRAGRNARLGSTRPVPGASRSPEAGGSEGGVDTAYAIK